MSIIKNVPQIVNKAKEIGKMSKDRSVFYSLAGRHSIDRRFRPYSLIHPDYNSGWMVRVSFHISDVYRVSERSLISKLT